MQSIDIEHQIQKFVVENFLYGNDQGLQHDESLLAKGVIDSTGVLELVAFLQEHFGITVEDEEIVPENLDSISNLVGYVANKVAPKA